MVYLPPPPSPSVLGQCLLRCPEGHAFMREVFRSANVFPPLFSRRIQSPKKKILMLFPFCLLSASLFPQLCGTRDEIFKVGTFPFLWDPGLLFPPPMEQERHSIRSRAPLKFRVPPFRISLLLSRPHPLTSSLFLIFSVPFPLPSIIFFCPSPPFSVSRD